MTMHTFEVEGHSGIMVKIQAILQAVLGNLEISAEFNENYNPTILGIDTKIFFRSLHLIIFFSLILISSLIIRKKILIYLSGVFFIGILIYYLIFILRETYGYNIFLFPLYLIIFSLLLNNLDRRYLLIFSSTLFLIFIMENFLCLACIKMYLKRA